MIEIQSGIVIDFNNDKLHSVTLKNLMTELALSKNQMMIGRDTIPELVEVTERCLNKFLAESQPYQPVVDILGNTAFTRTKALACMIASAATPTNNSVNANGDLNRGASIQLITGKDKEAIAYPIFLMFNPVSGAQTTQVQDAAYARHCRTPSASPSKLYNEILAHAFIVQPVCENAKKIIITILSMPKI